MRKQKITIITSDQKIDFNVENPRTDEDEKVLAEKKELPEKYGIIHSPKTSYEDIATSDLNFPVDVIFVNSFGDILKIIHNADPVVKKSYKCDHCWAILEIKAGDCKKFGIQEEDSVISSKFHLSSDNAYYDQGIMFKKLNSRTINNINLDDIAFFTYAEEGAMGWSKSIFMFLKNENGIEKYGISDFKILEKDGKSIEQFFEPIKNHDDIQVILPTPTIDEKGFQTFDISDIIVLKKNGKNSSDNEQSNWEYYSLGMGNHLYVKKEYDMQFQEELIKEGISDESSLYNIWGRLAYKILTNKCDQKKIENREYWVKQKYYGINTINVTKVLDEKWWETIELDEFILMADDDDYFRIQYQNTEETILDFAIKHCQNKDVLAALKYKVEKDIL